MNELFGTTGEGVGAAIGFGMSMVVRATALFLLCWMLHAALGRRRAPARSSVWSTALVGLLGVPVVGLTLPRLQVPLLRVNQTPTLAGQKEHGKPAVADDFADDVLRARAANDFPRSENVGEDFSASGASSLAARSPAAAGPGRNNGPLSPLRREGRALGRPPARLGWSWVLVMTYVVVAAVLLIRLVGSLVAVRRLRRNCTTIESAAWLGARDRLAAQLGLLRHVELLMSYKVSVPVVVGYQRPAIILPRSLAVAIFPAPRAGLIDAVLLHELGHVRRGDFLWNVIRMLVQAVYWPHPLAWLLSGVVRSVREQVCDELCVAVLGSAPAYRAALVHVASGLARRPGPAVGLSMAHASDLGRRLAWIDATPGSSRCLPPWPLRLALVMTVLGVSVVAGSAELARAAAAAQTQTPKTEPAASTATKIPSDLGQIIAALRAEEERYRNVEYALEITTRAADPKAQDARGEVTSLVFRRVVLQGDRVFYSGETNSRAFKTDRRQEEISSYDGERTRTVIPGNCVNIHVGRFEHPDVYPAHCIPLIHYLVNFPLSVYLSGTGAIHTHPKYPQLARETGTGYEFPKVEARVEGEEVVDGLRCVKLRVNRWFRSDSPPLLQYLWLAPTRNYHCVKEQELFDDRTMREMHVDELHEAVRGVWLPAKITVIDYDRNAVRQKKQVISSRTMTVVKSVKLDPGYAGDFFRDVKIPPELPEFTIKDRSVVGSSLPEPIQDEAAEKKKLAEVVAKVREQELRYSELEVRARTTYRHVGSSLIMERTITDQTDEVHSRLHGALALFTRRNSHNTAGGERSDEREVQAFDGGWTRGLRQRSQSGQPEQRWASLRKGGAGKTEGRRDGIPVLRPHTFLVRDDWLYGPLSDLMVSPWHDKVNKYRLRFRYCGEEDLDGHPCVKVRGEVTTGEGQPPSSFMAFWLATDRNYIPIKLEHYGGNFGIRPIPGGIYRCDDFREIAPGLWYPFKSTLRAFDNWVKNAQGMVALNWRRVYEIESVRLSPAVDAALFHDVILPAKTKVQVSDEDGHYIGQFEQDLAGVAEVSPVRYLSLQSEAKVRAEEQKERQRAMDELVGKPAPEFPAEATWLNSKPLTWDGLRGKVVILDFWAEWCGPCRNDMPQLALLHDAREANELTVIGVHTPGSTSEAIKKVMDEFHLGYPMCIDVPPREGMRAWGDLFGQFAVRAIPHAVVVDGKGVIAACGPLQKVVSKATELVKKR